MSTIPAGLLPRVPGCEHGAPPQEIRALPGGRGANGVWRVRTVAGDFVLRVRHEPIDRPGSSARFELACHRLAADAGLAPALVDAAADGRWLLMRHVAGPVWSESRMLSDAGIDALGEVLSRLHSLDCRGLQRMDVPAMARAYVEQLRRLAPDKAHFAQAQLELIERESRELDGLSRAVLNHGDLMASNLIGDGRQPPVLVDWEYAQCADPTWDVACLLSYYPALEMSQDRLLAACGLGAADDRLILSLQKRLFSRFNHLWQHAEAGNWIS